MTPAEKYQQIKGQYKLSQYYLAEAQTRLSLQYLVSAFGLLMDSMMSEESSSEDTVKPEDPSLYSSISSQWSSPVNRDGSLTRSLLQDIWDWLSSVKIPGNEPGSWQVEVTLTPTGSTPTSKDTEQPSGTTQLSEKAVRLSRSGAPGTGVGARHRVYWDES